MMCSTQLSFAVGSCPQHLPLICIRHDTRSRDITRGQCARRFTIAKTNGSTTATLQQESVVPTHGARYYWRGEGESLWVFLSRICKCKGAKQMFAASGSRKRIQKRREGHHSTSILGFNPLGVGLNEDILHHITLVSEQKNGTILNLKHNTHRESETFSDTSVGFPNLVHHHRQQQSDLLCCNRWRAHCDTAGSWVSRDCSSTPPVSVSGHKQGDN